VAAAVCRPCGAPLRSGARFCAACGRSVESARAERAEPGPAPAPPAAASRPIRLAPVLAGLLILLLVVALLLLAARVRPVDTGDASNTPRNVAATLTAAAPSAP